MEIIYQTLLMELLLAVSIVVAHKVFEHFEATRRQQGAHDISMYRDSYCSCLDECKSRDWCTGISYSMTMTFCIVHGNDAIDKSPAESVGFVYSERSSWSEQTMTCDNPRCNGSRAVCSSGSADCTYKDCPLPAVTNAYIVLHGNLRTPGAKVAFKCETNYRVIGAKTAKCLQGQPEPTWNDQFPSCVIDGVTFSTTTGPITTTPSTTIDPTTTTSTTIDPTTTTSTTIDPTTTTTSTTTNSITTTTSTTTDPTTTSSTTTDPTTTTSTTIDPTTTTTSTTTNSITTTTSTTTDPTTTSSTTTDPTTTSSTTTDPTTTTSTTIDPTTTTTSTTTDPTTTTSTTTDPTTTTTPTTTDPTTTMTSTSTTTTPTSVVCAENWVSYENSCYFVDDTVWHTFDQANSFCTGLGAQVLVPDSQPETTFIESTLLNGRLYSYWIGVRYMSGTWVTVNGAGTLSFQNWQTGYPAACGTSGLQPCTVLQNSELYKWICQSCAVRSKTVCELGP